MVDIKWTPAAGAGSLRFTKRARDALGEDYSQWLDDGAEAADAALERVGVPAWIVWTALQVLLAFVFGRWVLRSVVMPWIHGVKSSKVASELMSEAKDAAKAKAADEQRNAKLKTDLEAEQRIDGPAQRQCRFCDVDVDEDFVDSHLGGKKHGKAVANQLKRGRPGTDCWTWRAKRPEEDTEKKWYGYR
eukprot:gene13438-8872_t